MRLFLATLSVLFLLPPGTPVAAAEGPTTLQVPAASRTDYLERRAKQVDRPSRSADRHHFHTDPLVGAIKFHRHVNNYTPPAPAPTPTTPTYSPAPESSGLNWSALRQCESGGNYQINTGNGYYGAYQFDLGTWRGVGGSGYPHQASPAEQDLRAQRLYSLRGRAPWPRCGALL